MLEVCFNVLMFERCSLRCFKGFMILEVCCGHCWYPSRKKLLLVSFFRTAGPLLTEFCSDNLASLQNI